MALTCSDRLTRYGSCRWWAHTEWARRPELNTEAPPSTKKKHAQSMPTSIKPLKQRSVQGAGSGAQTTLCARRRQWHSNNTLCEAQAVAHAQAHGWCTSWRLRVYRGPARLLAWIQAHWHARQKLGRLRQQGTN